MSRRGSSKLPEFRASQQVGEGGTADASGGTRSLIQLGQRVQQFGSQQLIRSQAQKAKQLGEMAGLNPNFKPSKFGGIATQQFNQSALQANRAMMSSDAILTTQKLKIEAQQSSPDAAVQAQNFKTMQSQAAEQMINQAPDANKGIIKNVLAHQTGQAMMDFQKSIFKQQQIKADASSIQIDNTMRATMLDQLNRVHWNAKDREIPNQEVAAAGQFLQQRIDAIQLREQASQLNPKQARLLIQHAKDGFNDQLIRSQFAAKLQEGGKQAKDFIDFVRNPEKTATGFTAARGALKKYSIKQRQALAHSLMGVARDQANTTAVSSSYFKTLVKDDTRAVLNGATPNVELRSQVELNHPKFLAQYDRIMEDSQVIYQDVKQIMKAPLSTQDRIIGESKPTNKKDPEFGRNLGNWDQTQKMVMTARVAVKNDSAKYFLNHPEMMHSVQGQTERDQVGINFDTMPADGWKPLPMNVMDHLAIAESRYTGKDVSESDVVTNNMAKGMVNQFNSLTNVQQKAALMQQWGQQSGKYFPNLIRNLINKGGLSTDAQYLIGVLPGDKNIETYSQMATLSKSELRDGIPDDDKKSIEKGRFNSNLEQYIHSISGYPNVDTAKHIEDLNAHLKDFSYASMKKNAHPETSGSSAWKHANDTFADRFTYFTLDGRTMRMPPKYDPDVVKITLQNAKTNEVKNFPFVVDRQFANEPVEVGRKSTFETLIKPGGFVANTDNDGAIYVDKNGIPMHDKDGNTMTKKFADMHISRQDLIESELSDISKLSSPDFLNEK